MPESYSCQNHYYLLLFDLDNLILYTVVTGYCLIKMSILSVIIYIYWIRCSNFIILVYHFFLVTKVALIILHPGKQWQGAHI